MKNELENFVQHNRDKFDRKTPDPAVLGGVLQKMQPKEKSAAKGILVPFRVIQWAAACIILFALAFAFWALQKQPQNVTVAGTPAVKVPALKKVQADSAKQPGTAEMTQTPTTRRKSMDEVDRDIATRKQSLVAKLTAQNLRSEKLVMFASLNNMESPATRIAAIDDAFKLKNADNDIVNALVETLNGDPNTNVRLAALDGLTRFYRETYVRKKLITSLKTQQDPFMQIALINLLTRMRESAVLSQLNKMVKDGSTEESVKGCAYSGILQLQSL